MNKREEEETDDEEENSRPMYKVDLPQPSTNDEGRYRLMKEYSDAKDDSVRQTQL